MATIRKKGNLQWHVQIRKKGFPHLTKTFNTKAEADLWAKTTESAMGGGSFVSKAEAERTTLYDALKRYRNEITPTKKGSAQEEIRINRWLGIRTEKFEAMLKKSKSKARDIPLEPDPLTLRTLASLTTADFSKWRDARLKTVSAATVVRDLSTFSHVFTACNKDWGIPVANPLSNIRKPKINNERERRFEGDEEKRLLDALADRSAGERYNPWMRPLVELAVETAMRQSELLKIKWADVKTQQKHIYIADTKNNKSREVPLSKRALAILKALPDHDGGEVFKTTQSAVAQAFPRACDRAKIVDFTFHDLRHEATSRLATKLEMHELMKMTGHKNAKMLLRYYHPKAATTAAKLG